jgi:hypothetical protein
MNFSNNLLNKIIYLQKISEVTVISIAELQELDKKLK